MSKGNRLDSTRWSLIRKLAGFQDARAWEEFYATYGRLIYSLAVAAGLTHEEAEDAVQDTVVSLVRNLPDFNTDPSAGSFKSWLFTLARWRIANQFEKRNPRGTLAKGTARGQRSDDTSRTAILERIQDPATVNVEATWEAEWRREALDIAIEKLKRTVEPRHFQVLYLHIAKKQPAAQVAKALGIHVGQVYLVKCRLLPRLKQILKGLESRPL